MSEVVERLEGLATSGHAGDWMDVVARAQRRRALDLRRRALIAVAAVLLLAVPTLALADRLGGLLVISDQRSEPPVPWIAGSRLHNLGDIDDRRIAAPLAWHPFSPFSPPLSNTSPAIASPDRGLLLYRATDPPDAPFSGRNTTPVLRLHYLASGRDRVVERGAASFAWRADGALAYAKAEAGTWAHPGGALGHVVVKASISEPAVRWTSERARYTVLAWARETLLVSAIAEGAATPPSGEGVYALTGPGRAQKLPLGGVVAIDPAGELVVGPIGLDPELGGGLTFRVVRVRDATVVSELDLTPVVAPQAPYATAWGVTGGSWVGSYIILTLPSVGPELRDALVLLRFNGTLEPAHVFRLEPYSAAEEGFGSEPNAFHSPRFLDAEAEEIVAWAGITERDGRDVFLASAFLHCNRMEKRCRRTEALPGTRYRITRPDLWSEPPVRAFVQNPSRPLPSS
jgi:hypothetical protein